MWYRQAQVNIAPSPNPVVPDQPGVDEGPDDELDGVIGIPPQSKVGPKIAPPTRTPALTDFTKKDPKTMAPVKDEPDTSPEGVQQQLEKEQALENSTRNDMEDIGMQSFADDGPEEEKQEEQADIQKLDEGGPSGDFLSFLGQNFPDIKLPKVHDNCTCQATENGWVLGHGEESCDQCQDLARRYDAALQQYRSQQQTQQVQPDQVSQANVWSKRFVLSNSDSELYKILMWTEK